MKITLFLAIATLVPLAATRAADPSSPAKPPLRVEVKRHLIEADSNRVLGGDTHTKTYTLRAQLTNVSSSLVEGCEISGEALVQRAIEDQEKLVRETIDAAEIPAMKPNAKITIDLGKITVRRVEWRHNEFEESVEHWKVVCTKDGKEIAGYMSAPNYTSLSKDAASSEFRKPEAPARRPLAPNREAAKRRFLK